MIYAELGVQEYYIFDPLGDYLDPRLRGYQLIDGELLPLPGPRIFSKLLNAELQVEGDTLRLFDLASQTRLLTPYDAEAARLDEAAARRAAEAARLDEAAARRAAEAEVERLRAEIERLRAGQA